MKEKIANTLRIIIVSFLLSTAIGYSLANWAPPPPCGAPPCGNTPPPINVGPATQMREGDLFLNNWLVAQKAQTILSTVGTPGCVPGPGCDGPTTLVTKDYVDGQMAGVGALKFIQGTSCPACPYGSYHSYSSGGGDEQYSCVFKDQNGTLLSPVVPTGAGGFTPNGISDNQKRICHVDSLSVGGDYRFAFWSY